MEKLTLDDLRGPACRIWSSPPTSAHSTATRRFKASIGPGWSGLTVLLTEVGDQMMIPDEAIDNAERLLREAFATRVSGEGARIFGEPQSNRGPRAANGVKRLTSATCGGSSRGNAG
jgi:hypothetical protein